MQRFIKGLNPLLLSSMAGLFTLVQFLFSALLYNPKGNLYLTILGGVCGAAALAIGWLAMTEVRWRANPRSNPKGKKGASPTKRPLITDGVFALARHPQQGTAWILMSLALALVSQHWAVAVLGVVSILLAYANVLHTDQAMLEQFGEPYREYMAKVPLVNILAGLLRRWQPK